MQIILITVGKTKTSFLQEGIRNYIQRLKHYIDFSLIELPDLKSVKSLSANEQKHKEGLAICEKLYTSDHVIILDEKGREMNSLHFANYMEKIMTSGRKRIVYIIGGPYGFSEQVYDRADAKLSLSQMTFNHEMVRLFFIEQLYRSMTIIRGEPYHHE